MFKRRQTNLRGPESLAGDLAFALKAYRRAYLRSITSETTLAAEKEVSYYRKQLENAIGKEQAAAVELGIDVTLSM